MQEPSAPTCLTFHFGNCQYEADLRLLTDGERTSRLRPQAAKLLELLLMHPDRVVSRDEIRHELWGDEYVVEYDLGIAACIKQLRHELRDTATNPRYIETIPRRGYHFICKVSHRIEKYSNKTVIKQEELEQKLDSQDGKSIDNQRHNKALVMFAALAFLLVLVAIVFWYISELNASKSKVMLAVLPFDVLLEGSNQEILRHALLDDLITEFGTAIPNRLGVISRTSAFGVELRSLTAAEIGGALSVDYVLDGSVRRVDEQWLVSVSVASVEDDSFVWGAVIDLPSTHPALSRKLAQRIREDLLRVLFPGELLPGPEIVVEQEELLLEIKMIEP